MKIVFVFNTPGFLRYFDTTVELLCARGHEVTVAFLRPDLRPEALEAFEAMERRPAVVDRAPVRTDAYAPVAAALRALIDYVRYLDPRYSDAEYLRSRRRVRVAVVAPFIEMLLARRRSLPAPVVRALIRSLLAFERALPSAREVEKWLERLEPDVLVVSPLVTAASPQVDYVKSARRLGIPTGLCVASWDNLTNKGLMRELPDRVFVWNELQRAEAVQFHGCDPSAVVTTGAPGFDRWFGHPPATRRDDFCRRAGLRSDRPYVLFVGSTGNIAEAGVEELFIRRWADAVRAADSELGILVRPHPDRKGEWDAVDLRGIGNAALWPRARPNSVTAEARDDYFDSLHHAAAVVGINTSAMVEAALVGRPVLSVRAPEFEQAQGGTIHFGYLLPEQGGPLIVAADLAEHSEQLLEAVRSPERAAEQDARFTDAFVRPLGRDVSATAALADAIEALSELEPARPRRPSIALRAIEWLVATAYGLGVTARGSAGRGVRREVRAETIRRRRIARSQSVKAEGSRLLGASARAADGSRTIVFVLRHSGFVRNFESVLRALAARGHRIELVFTVHRDTAPLADELAGEFPNLTHLEGPVRRDSWASFAYVVRYAIDYLRYLSDFYRDAEPLRARGKRRVPVWFVWLSTSRLFRSPRRLAFLDRLLRSADRAIPTCTEIDAFLARRRPDLVMVTPLLAGPDQTEYVRSAQRLGIHSALPVTSWDNLTNKGLIRDLPERVWVWNETQRREAIELHGVSPDVVVAVGAHTYDHWFDWAPSTSREEFCRRAGIPADRPFLLYVCSSGFVAANERAIVERWLEELRTTDDVALREASVVVRPHPGLLAEWERAPLASDWRAAVWPTEDLDPRHRKSREEYYDSFHHAAAAVGLNTTALIEAAIVGCKPFTFDASAFGAAQRGTIHFHYLLEENGGPAKWAATFDEHREQLAAALRDGAADGWNAPFVRSFIRPHGLDVAATPLLVDEIESLAAAPGPAPARLGLRRALLRATLRPAAAAASAGRLAARVRRRRTR